MATGKVAERRSEVPTSTYAPFDLRADLADRIGELGLSERVKDMRDEGYTVIRDIAMPAFTQRLRDTCLRLSQETPGMGKGRSAGMLFGRDPIFEEVVLNPKLLAMVEVMCGRGAVLSQLVASIRPNGSPELPLHADQNWFPAPFPEHNQLFTMCWVMDPFTQEAGATRVIPRSHVHRRHPSSEEIAAGKGAIPIECPANSLACWDGSVWHGNYPRTIDGDRVVLHITFGRLALRPVESYDHLGEEWLKGKPEALRILLGREDFLGKSGLGGADYTRIPKTFEWAKN
jgi:hypothetical protein